MLYAPPLAMAIFIALLRKEGYQVDLFDATPYVGEGASAPVEGTFVGDEMNTIRADKNSVEKKLTFQSKITEEKMGELVRARPFSLADLCKQSIIPLYSFSLVWAESLLRTDSKGYMEVYETMPAIPPDKK